VQSVFVLKIGSESVAVILPADKNVAQMEAAHAHELLFRPSVSNQS